MDKHRRTEKIKKLINSKFRKNFEGIGFGSVIDPYIKLDCDHGKIQLSNWAIYLAGRYSNMSPSCAGWAPDTECRAEADTEDDAWYRFWLIINITENNFEKYVEMSHKIREGIRQVHNEYMSAPKEHDSNYDPFVASNTGLRIRMDLVWYCVINEYAKIVALSQEIIDIC